MAARRVAELRDKLIGRAKFAETNTSWKEAVVAWSAFIGQQVGSQRTAKRYTDSLGIAGQFFATKAIADVGKEDINRFVTTRQAKVSNATIRRDLQALSSLFDFAEDHGWREGNPAQAKMRRLKEHRDPITLPDEDDYAFVLSRLAPAYADLLRAARATGMRQSELTSAERKHLNKDKGSLLVRGKGNKQRAISLSPEAMEILSRQPAAIGCPLIFSHNGKPITKAAFVFSRARRTAQAAAKKAGLPFRGFRFHDMRHLYAVETLRNGGNIYALQQHLRHSSVKTTEMYLEFLTPEEADAAKRSRLDPDGVPGEEGETAAPQKAARDKRF